MPSVNHIPSARIVEARVVGAHVVGPCVVDPESANQFIKEVEVKPLSLNKQ